MSLQTFSFEKPIVDLEERIEALKDDEGTEQNKAELRALEKELGTLKKKIYQNLSPWERVQIARHMMRPRALDYINLLITDWQEIKGDRGFHDDHAVVCGLGRFEGEPVAVIGQQKGKDTKENVFRNFGMMHPEGYRKAMRVMRMAERFKLPLLIFIDTPGAYPGLGAEERGQGEAIARNIMDMFEIRTPIIGTIIGEGASGGALGIGVVDHMVMQENSWYCVISPEGCASILWRDAAMAPTAATALKMTAPDLLEQTIIDEIAPEPLGGAHHSPEDAAEFLRAIYRTQLERLKALPMDQLLETRFQKFRHLGQVIEP